MEDLRDEWPEGYVPTFDYDETVYRKVQLARDGATAEFIYSSGMTCDGKRLGTCGSGGCSGHIIFNGHDYEIFGGPLFLLHPEAGVNGGVKFGHCGGAKVGQFGASALERAALI